MQTYRAVDERHGWQLRWLCVMRKREDRRTDVEREEQREEEARSVRQEGKVIRWTK